MLFKIFSIFLISIFWIAKPAPSQEIIPLINEEIILELGPQASILVDTGGNYNIQEVASSSFSKNFHFPKKRVPNLGLTRSVVWVRIQVKNLTFTESWALQAANPDMDNVELYINDDLNWKVMELGQKLPFSSRDIVNRNLLFNLTLPFGEEKTLYLRYQNESGMTIPLRLYAYQQYQTYALGEQLVFGIFFGFMLVLGLYNLILYLKVKESGYLFYFLYIVGYGMFQFSLYGLAYQYLWPKWNWWANNNVSFFLALALFCRILFTMSILDSKSNLPGWHKALKILLAALALLAGYHALRVSHLIPPELGLGRTTSIWVGAFYFAFFTVIISTLNILSLRKKIPAAKTFMVAWIFMVSGFLLFTLKELGILPSNLITEYGIPLGTVGEMCLLFVSLGESIQAIKSEAKERQRRQQAATQAFQKEQIHAMRLEMELLKANIHPHFMLNSLNAATMWLREDPETAEKLLQALSDELKQMLKIVSEKSVAIGAEIEICRKHLEVMSLRHDKEFTLLLENIRPEERIPPMVFHTLVENGLTHGYARKEKGVFILRRKEDSEKFYFSLFNDGESHQKNIESNGLGLKYVRARLQESFGDFWDLQSGPVQNGWEVTIAIKKTTTKPEGGSPENEVDIIRNQAQTHGT